MERLAPTEMKKSNIARPYIRFDQVKSSSRDILSAEGLTKSFDGRVILNNVTLEVQRGEKMAIIGANGAGKTTLIRTLIGELTPEAGSVKWGFGAKWGYYPQDFGDQVTPGMTVIDWLMQFAGEIDHQTVRGLLGRMLFSGDDGLKPTEALSGGETARLLLARIMLEQNPILIFDEPTNHLDLESVSALGEGLSQFQGTVLVVTHDRDLISSCADRILSFTPEGLIDFHGNYEEYLAVHPLPEYEARAKWS
jgi:ATPase subunit of ABC transporter with duplicated ATPase domains